MGHQDAPFHVGYADPDAERRRLTVDALTPEYEVSATAALDEAADALEYGVDCLVGATGHDEWESADLLAIGEEWELPVVAIASRLDPELVRTATRRDDVDLVLRDDAWDASDAMGTCDGEETGGSGDETVVETVRERVDEVRRRSISGIGDVVLDASRSLMGAAPDEVDTKIEWELKTVGQRLDADRCVFYPQTDPDDPPRQQMVAYAVSESRSCRSR